MVDARLRPAIIHRPRRKVETYRRALVLGMGVSGRAAARLLLAEGSEVTVVDREGSEEIAAAARQLAGAGARTLMNCGQLPAGAFDVCVVSPGVAIDSPWMNEVRDRGMLFMSELELGASRCSCPILAVTGSNGKSTMVKLCGEALTLAGKRTVVAGNYGLAISEAAPGSGGLDRIVAEVSSFQLETVRNFHPDVGVVLNIQPDHLNRHGDIETYARMKSRLFDVMDESDTGIVFEADAEGMARLSCGHNRWLSFGVDETATYRYGGGEVAWLEDGDGDAAGGRRRISVAGTPFDNDVMGVTAAAAVAAVSACGVEAEAVAGAARAFEPLPHRMQRVAAAGGVTFVNDSKATNLSAMKAALRMLEGKVRLVAGGLLKEGGLEDMAGHLAGRVAGAYLIGTAADEMAAAWGSTVPCDRCGDLRTALERAWGDRQAGETILLSPGCASFDQFMNFEERGDRFAAIARELAEEENHDRD